MLFEMSINISGFLDVNGKVKIWPAKRDKKEEVLKYLASKFECDRFYTEKEVNAIAEQWHTFGDYFLIRRELVDFGLLSRTTDGSKYWKEKKEKQMGSSQNLQI